MLFVQIDQITGKTKRVWLGKDPVTIGSKFTGPNWFVDTPNGTSWQVMPAMTYNELGIQCALLNKKAPKLWVDPRMVLPKPPKCDLMDELKASRALVNEPVSGLHA